MRAGLVAVAAAAMMVAGCATVRDSRVNPLNWFGSSQERAIVEAVEKTGRTDGRVRVQELTELHIERATGGVIVRAKGVPLTQGRYHAELSQIPGGDEGELAFEFLIKEPEAEQRASTPISREITVATFVNNYRLETARTITVRAASNARSSNR